MYESARELVVLAGVGVRGVVLLALERVDDLVVVVARQLDDDARRRRRLSGVRRFDQADDVEPDGLAQALLRLGSLADRVPVRKSNSESGRVDAQPYQVLQT